MTILGHPYSRRKPPPDYNFGWLDQELQNIQRGYPSPPTGMAHSDLTTYLANNAVISPLDQGGVGDNSADDTGAIQRARDRMATSGPAFGGAVYFPPGYVWKTTAKIAGKRNVKFIGACPSGVAPGTTYNGVSVIRGAHTDNAILDFSGVQGSGVQDLKLYGDQTLVPKTGLLLGRTSSASAGFHRLINVSVEGYFSKAAVYSIASEENHWDRPHISLLGGGAKYCFYTSQGDDLSVAGLTGSSNITCTLVNPWMSSAVNDATSSLIYINAGGSTWNWNFQTAYLIPKSGAYVTINTGSVDAADCPGSINFWGVSGEINTGGLNPITGFDLTSPGAFTLHGLNVIGCKMAFDAAGKFLRQGANLSIDDSLVRGGKMGVDSSLVTSQITNSWLTDGTSDVLKFYGDMQLSGKFGCNTKTPQSAYAVGGAATDPASTQTLANNLRLMAIANGIAV